MAEQVTPETAQRLREAIEATISFLECIEWTERSTEEEAANLQHELEEAAEAALVRAEGVTPLSVGTDPPRLTFAEFAPQEAEGVARSLSAQVAVSDVDWLREELTALPFYIASRTSEHGSAPGFRREDVKGVLDQLLARLRSAGPIPQWQPMASAPKDGRGLLLWSHHWRDGGQMVREPAIARWSSFSNCFVTDEGEVYKPTQWTELPRASVPHEPQ